MDAECFFFNAQHVCLYQFFHLHTLVRGAHALIYGVTTSQHFSAPCICNSVIAQSTSVPGLSLMNPTCNTFAHSFLSKENFACCQSKAWVEWKCELQIYTVFPRWLRILSTNLSPVDLFMKPTLICVYSTKRSTRQTSERSRESALWDVRRSLQSWHFLWNVVWIFTNIQYIK